MGRTSRRGTARSSRIFELPPNSWPHACAERMENIHICVAKVVLAGKNNNGARKQSRPKAPTEVKPPEVTSRRGRANRPFPSCSYAEAEAFARALYDAGSGQSVRRLTLFDQIGKSPESSASREIVTNANKYLLVKGGYQAESLSLTDDAMLIFSESTSVSERARNRVKLAIDSIAVFKALYDRFKGHKRPANAVLMDAAKEAGVPTEHLNEAVDRFVVNLENVGLLQTLSGSERILTEDHLVDARSTATSFTNSTSSQAETHSALPVTAEHANFESMCFYITPIGDEGSNFRLHSDLFLGSIVEPALDTLKLKVVRADKIDKPGTISRQVFEYIRRARIVIADLSFHNPNVFYELAVRHMLRKPVVQICQVGDMPPFDINQMRTIFIDNTSIYTLVPRLETYKSEIANQVRRALDDPDSADNPISTYYPELAISGL